MNLREAIERGEEDAARGHCSIRLLSDEWNAILTAAKKQLAAEEAAKPKRASLEEIENGLRGVCLEYSRAGWIGSVVDAVDILKALREKIIPKLRVGAGVSIPAIVADEMLMELGEDPCEGSR